MIRIQKEALALNAKRVPGPDYRMDQTVKLSKFAGAIEVSKMILLAVSNTNGDFLENVVINCHGSPGMLHTGKDTSIEIGQLGAFNFVKNMIGTIWIVACQIAGHSIGRSGNAFCSQLAKTAGCNVVGSDVSQWVNPGYYLRFFPKNFIDNYEGNVYRWDSSGKKEVFNPKKRI